MGEDEEDDMKPSWWNVALAALAVGFAWVVWPTPYRTIGPRGVIQVNRFTGVRCDVGQSCWRQPPEPAPTVRFKDQIFRPRREVTASQGGVGRWEKAKKKQC